MQQYDRKVLSQNELREFYGQFFERGPNCQLDPNRVPVALHPLIPYANFWGEPDDEFRSELLREAAAEVRRNLDFAVEQYVDVLREWLSRPDTISTSNEYVAFTNLLMVYDHP
jgi:hypothetical protein